MEIVSYAISSTSPIISLVYLKFSIVLVDQSSNIILPARLPVTDTAIASASVIGSVLPCPPDTIIFVSGFGGISSSVPNDCQRKSGHTIS